MSAGAKPKESLLCNSTTDPPPDHIRITTRSPVNLDPKFNVLQVYGDTVLLGLGRGPASPVASWLDLTTRAKRFASYQL